MRVDVRQTASAGETERVGAEIAAALQPGQVVLLRGDLGAGKTTLVRGAARALGADGAVSSPTFALAHRYDGTTVRVAHLDLYRLGGGPLGDDDEQLIEDELHGDVIAFVEWPDPLEPLVAGRVALTAELQHDGEDRRRIELRWAR